MRAGPPRRVSVGAFWWLAALLLTLTGIRLGTACRRPVVDASPRRLPHRAKSVPGPAVRGHAHGTGDAGGRGRQDLARCDKLRTSPSLSADGTTIYFGMGFDFCSVDAATMANERLPAPPRRCLRLLAGRRADGTIYMGDRDNSLNAYISIPATARLL